ncbi:MAG: hypothetical protein AB1689_10435 [Thermodesulfobacteriota bacterium]
MNEATTFETLTVTVDGRLGRLTLNRPGKLNALGSRRPSKS